MKIKLSNGKEVMIDKEDYVPVSRYSWWEDRGYARTEKQKDNQVSVIYMHNLIMQTVPGTVDHVNQNKLDNRKVNLRLCTKAENNRNVAVRKDNSTGYKGVSFHRLTGKYQASLRINGKKKYLGIYSDARLAAKAYNVAAKRYFGDFAYLNVEVDLE